MIFGIRTKLFNGYHPKREKVRSTSIFNLIFLTACASYAPSLPVEEEQTLSDSLQYTDLDPIIRLEDSLAYFLSQDPQCPLLSYEDTNKVWHGNCETVLGYSVEGTLRSIPTGGVEGDGFSISQRDKQLLYLNGILAITEYGSLLQIDLIGQGCGLYGFSEENSERYLLHPNDCSLGTAHFSLRASIYPFSGYPEEYDTTLYGSIFQQETPLLLDGYWNSSAQCFGEPMTGILSVQQEQKHRLTLDGEKNCDGCALWTNQGESLGSFCGAFP